MKQKAEDSGAQIQFQEALKLWVHWAQAARVDPFTPVGLQA